MLKSLTYRLTSGAIAERAYSTTAAVPAVPIPRPRWAGATQTLTLEPEEREALATKDYGRLYALGAHPFTLWSFTEAVWVHEIPREELVADYKAKAAKAGYPSFKT